MSKDFEKAYRELAQTEVPDLWDRIEAGLTDKSAPVNALNIEKAALEEKAVEQENISKEFEAETEKKELKKDSREQKTEDGKQEQKKKNNVVVFLKRYSTAVAAIVCVAILIPAISLIGSFGVGGSKSAEAESLSLPAAEAPAEMADMVAAEEMVEETTAEETGAEGALAEVTEECAAEEAPAEVTEECAAEEAPAEMTEEAAAEEAPFEKEEMKEAERVTAENAEAEKMSDDLRSEGTQISKVQVEVLQIVDGEEYFAGTGKEERGRIYYARVLSCPSDLLTQGEQIAIFISEYYSIALIEEERYELTLTPVTEEGKHYFLIEEFHQRLTQ